MLKDLLTAVAVATFYLLPAATAPAKSREEIPVFFLADPQIHNVHGTALKQMSPLSDWFAPVAIRPPEVNLLAPLVLRHALKTGTEKLGNPNSLIVVLGDGTNIGCSGEADAFDAEFARYGTAAIRLMAHGNHDSYMMGTVNSYGPYGSNTWMPGRMMEEDLPVDEAWWIPTPEPERTASTMLGRNWLDSCYMPARTAAGQAGTPMNKVRWLARYAAGLAAHGLRQRFEGMAVHEGRRFSGSAEPGSSLAALNYRSRGIWYRPEPGVGNKSADYARAWNSFLVQAVDVSDRHTLVLIDTSVCQNARGGIPYLWSNAGTNSCIGQAQFQVIKQVLGEIDAGRHVIFAGHFPLDALRWRERRKLQSLMKQQNPNGWTYVSGHTHEAHVPTEYENGVDMNIGSTTDWPMESHVFRFDATSSAVAGVDSFVLSKEFQPLGYQLDYDLAGRYSELCRHFEVARALAEAGPSDYKAIWGSPRMEKDQCEAIQSRWQQSAQALTRYQQRISERFDDPQESAYRRFILQVASGASRYESGQRRFGPRKVP